MRVQLLTGMRPVEGCKVRYCDIKKTREEYAAAGILYDTYNDYEGETWLYVLDQHKTKKKIGRKIVPICKEAQEVFLKWLRPGEPEKPVFPNKRGNPYTTHRYDVIVARTIAEHGLPKFTPHQIRHTYTTLTSKKHGRDVARAAAFHTSEKTTAIYDHADIEKRLAVMREQNRAYNVINTHAVGYEFTAAAPPTLRIFSGE